MLSTCCHAGQYSFHVAHMKRIWGNVLERLSDHPMILCSRTDARERTATCSHGRSYRRRHVNIKNLAHLKHNFSLCSDQAPPPSQQLELDGLAGGTRGGGCAGIEITHDKTKRSRLSQSGFLGLKFMNLLNITWATGAMPMGAPG